jgi:2,4-dienoyl-CoA reductase-like NADH-dependent reductase (Old Yellow Enzyme family)
MTGGDYDVPHTLEINEIKAIVQAYFQAALNTIEAGFDVLKFMVLMVIL